MAVIAVWKCDRDNSMFTNKKDAEEHDKMLELAENITALIDSNIEGVDEKHECESKEHECESKEGEIEKKTIRKMMSWSIQGLMVAAWLGLRLIIV